MRAASIRSTAACWRSSSCVISSRAPRSSPCSSSSPAPRRHGPIVTSRNDSALRTAAGSWPRNSSSPVCPGAFGQVMQPTARGVTVADGGGGPSGPGSARPDHTATDGRGSRTVSATDTWVRCCPLLSTVAYSCSRQWAPWRHGGSPSTAERRGTRGVGPDGDQRGSDAHGAGGVDRPRVGVGCVAADASHGRASAQDRPGSPIAELAR